MSIIILLQSFDPTGMAYAIMGLHPKHAVVYAGFNSAWYLNIGRKLCFSIFMSSVLSNFNEIKQIVDVFLTRFLDRGKKLNIKKDLEDEGDDEVNTKLGT